MIFGGNFVRQIDRKTDRKIHKSLLESPEIADEPDKLKKLSISYFSFLGLFSIHEGVAVPLNPSKSSPKIFVKNLPIIPLLKSVSCAPSL